MEAERYGTLSDFFEKKRREYVDECLPGCTSCYEVCSAIPFSRLKDQDPSDVKDKVMALLRDGVYSWEAEERFNTCFYCGMCGPVVECCPAGISDMRIVLPIGRKILKGLGREIPVGVQRLDPGNRYANLYVFSALQMKPSEKTWLSPHQVPSDPGHKDVVLFTGCTPHNVPNLIFTTMDIFTKMGIDFVALGGGGFCCGNMHQLMGDMDGSERYIRELHRAITAFRPRTVVNFCGTCEYQMRNVFPSIVEMPRTQFITSFLLEDFDRIRPHLRPLHRRVTLHESCNIPRYLGDTDSIRELLGRIPGLELVEMKHVKKETICCGGGGYYLLGYETARGFADRRLNEAKETKADAMVCGGCQGCYYIFIGRQGEYPFEILHSIMVLGEAMGIRHEEKLKKYFMHDDVDKIFEDAKEYIEASDFGLDEMKALLPKIFKGKAMLVPLD
jgi:heterodisulfide reductase subunit D